MKFLIQRVTQATVKFPELHEQRSIGIWLLVYVWIGKIDNEISSEHLEMIANKLIELKLFEDENGKIKRTLKEVQWELLVVSNFTLRWATKGWSHIDFWEAAGFDTAKALYDRLVNCFHALPLHLQTWLFGAYMEVESIGDGPVNIVIDR